MTVFKTFLKIVNKYKSMIILYTVILVAFAGFNLQTSDSSTNFSQTKPSVLIVNNDSNAGVTRNLIDYISSNCEIKSIKNDDESISDALFYRSVSYIIYIPENYSNDFLNGNNPEIEIKSTGDYEAYYADMLLTRYLDVANKYSKFIKNEDELIKSINKTFSKNVDVELTSKLDSSSLDKAVFYYNFLNYSILAGCVYVVCLILSSFRNENIRKRTIISGTDYKKINRELLLSNGLLILILLLFYVLLSYILIGKIVFSSHGLLLILNSFIFSICALTLAFLIGTILNNKNAIDGIINVIALGSSFLCGAFVPAQFLPNSVLMVAHILPTFWYINSNNLIKSIKIISFDSIQPILINMIVILLFSVLFIILSNVFSKRKL